MSDHALSEDHEGPALTHPAADTNVRTRWFSRILPLILFLLLVAAVAIQYRTLIFTGENPFVALVFTIILSIFLSLLPAMICVVQNTTRRRQLTRLHALRRFPVSRSAYFQTALTAVDMSRTGAVDTDFEAPLFVYFFVVFMGSLAFLIGYTFNYVFNMPSLLLAGMHRGNEPDFAAYQAGTFSMMGMAFVAAYVYSLGRLLDRVNNNDLYPISLYYYAVRIVIACAAAGVVRHTADVFGLRDTSALLLVAFAIGFAPDLLILALTRRAFQMLKVRGSRDDPPAEALPPTLPLLMIDDLSREKIDRLAELGIDSAQVLARQNPFLLLPRLPYDLGLLVDWIGQAQLYLLVREKIGALRMIFVRDVFDLRIRLQSTEARAAICAALGITEPEAAALEEELLQEPSFTRLAEVREALIPQPAAG